MKKSPVERMHLNFERFTEDLADGLSTDRLIVVLAYGTIAESPQLTATASFNSIGDPS